MKLVVGYVPEHFSTPLFLAERHGFYAKHGVTVEFRPFPSGTGHLIASLKDGSINAAVGLTEAFVRGIAAGADHYKLVGTYVESPLCWAVSTGAERAAPASVAALEGATCGVSRMGSGSDVMSRVLQQQQGWTKPFAYRPLDTFARLREAVNSGAADFFMWEHFTSKKYYDSGEIKRIGEIYTPWPSWVVVARTDVVAERQAIAAFAAAVNDGIAYFNAHPDEGVEYIHTHFDYSEADARAWLQTVKFSADAAAVDPAVVAKTVSTLKNATELPEGCEDREYVARI